MKDNLPDREFLVKVPPPTFDHFKYFMTLLLAYKVSARKYADSLMEFPLFITKHFSFAAFKILSLSLFLFIFIIICLSLSLWVQVIWNSLGSLDLDVYFLPKIMVWG